MGHILQLRLERKGKERDRDMGKVESVLSDRELAEFPEADVVLDEWCLAARSAEEKKNWKRAQVLWEYAMIDATPEKSEESLDGSDKETDERREKEYDRLGFTGVIIPHLYQLMKEHLSFEARDRFHAAMSANKAEKRRKPMGMCQAAVKQLEERYQIIHNTDTPSAFGIIVRILLFALHLIGALMLPYPFPEWLVTVEAVHLLIVMLVVAWFVGAIFGIWGGLIAFGVMWFLANGIPELISDILKLDNEALGENYFFRGLWGIVAFILVCSLLSALRKISRHRKAVAEAGKGYTADAERLYCHLEKCADACGRWSSLSAAEDMTEVFAIRLKYSYVHYDQCPFLGFGQISGTPREGWGDALDVEEYFFDLHLYYIELCQTVAKYLEYSEKYRDVYRKYVKEA